MIFELLSIIIFALFCAWNIISKKHKNLEPPELSGRIPIVGHGHLFFGDGVAYHEALTKISEECLKKGGVATMQLGPLWSGKVYVITDPEDVLNILNTCMTRHYYWDFSRPILGNGLLTADVTTWKKHRRLLTPAFSQHALDSYIDIFNSQALELVGRFATELGRPFDHEHLLRMYALQTICGTVCGLNPSEYRDYFEQYLEQLERWMTTITTRMFRIWCHNDFFYSFFPEKLELDTQLKYFKALAKNIVEKTKQKKLSENKEKGNENFTIKAKSSAFMMPHGLLRHSTWGPDADQFRPERWFDKETLPDPKYIALFGLGKRACIGKTYAMMSMKMVLAHVLRRYHVSADANKIKIRFATMSRPESGHFVTLKNRQLY